MNRLTLIAVLAFWGQAQFLAAQDLQSLKFQSKEARSAIRIYQRAGEDATKEFEKAREKATEELVEELNAVFEKEKSRGNVDEALLLRKTLEQVKSHTPRTESGIEVVLIGNWTIQYPDYKHELEIRKQGDKLSYTLSHGPNLSRKDTGEVELVNGFFAINFGRNAVSRCHLHGGRLYVEFWLNRSEVGGPNLPDHMAIGVKGE